MNTLKKIIAAPWDRTGSAAAVLALPHAPALSLVIGERMRRRIAVVLLAVVTAAVGAYVIAVNAILLHGEAMKREEKSVAALEQEYAALHTKLLGRQSPAWLEAQARTQGMVSVQGLRYLTHYQSVALSQ